MHLRFAQTLLSVLVYLSFTGCGGHGHDHSEHDHEAPEAGAELLPESFWSETAPADAQDVKIIRDEVDGGVDVVVRGTVMDFGELATFKLVEDSLEDCTEMGEEDHCATPWDFCCADPAALARYTMNVEFLDGDLPGEWKVQGFHGIDHLTEVVVTGKLHKDDAGNMRLAAAKIALQ